MRITLATKIRNRFHAWWKRSRAEDFVYETKYVEALVRSAAESAYKAGWHAAKAERLRS